MFGTKKPPREIKLLPPEGAIVLRVENIEVVYPEPLSGSPIELRDTLDFVRFALERPDWIKQWWEERDFRAAVEDILEDEPPAPKLELIEGGLTEKSKPKNE